jgi:hypothetical protein
MTNILASKTTDEYVKISKELLDFLYKKNCNICDVYTILSVMIKTIKDVTKKCNASIIEVEIKDDETHTEKN